MRKMSAQALEDLVDAVGEVKALQERTVEADRNAQVDVSVQVIPVPPSPYLSKTCQVKLLR